LALALDETLGHGVRGQGCRARAAGQCAGERGGTEEMNLRKLVGSGDRIGLFVLPVVVGGVLLNLANPSVFQVGGPPTWLAALAIAVLIVGVAIWIWSVILILANVPSGRLITSGPYAWVKHPLYTAVALLVLPWVGFLLNTWLGVVIGVALYLASRLFAPAEEAELSRTFGVTWQAYSRSVKLQWL
jgi:protein-S-isoprenylcysteine O-methyltransferase Ste14